MGGGHCRFDFKDSNADFSSAENKARSDDYFSKSKWMKPSMKYFPDFCISYSRGSLSMANLLVLAITQISALYSRKSLGNDWASGLEACFKSSDLSP
jgi:hypothetical protein